MSETLERKNIGIWQEQTGYSSSFNSVITVLTALSLFPF